MRKTILKHKTTITASITALLCLGACVRWFMGQINADELQSFCVAAGVVSGILIGVFAKDGTVKKEQEPKP